MKVIIAGSRDIISLDAVRTAALTSKFQITEVVSGGARGVDRLGEQWAERNGIQIKQFIPEWQDDKGRFVKAAGIYRNANMAGYADALIAIWDGKSRGTLDMITRMVAMAKPVYVYCPT